MCVNRIYKKAFVIPFIYVFEFYLVPFINLHRVLLWGMHSLV